MSAAGVGALTKPKKNWQTLRQRIGLYPVHFRQLPRTAVQGGCWNAIGWMSGIGQPVYGASRPIAGIKTTARSVAHFPGCPEASRKRIFITGMVALAPHALDIPRSWRFVYFGYFTSCTIFDQLDCELTKSRRGLTEDDAVGHQTGWLSGALNLCFIPAAGTTAYNQ